MEQKKDFSFRELFESPSKNRSRQEPWYYALLLYLVIFISLMSLVNVALQASYASSQLKEIKKMQENLAIISDNVQDDLMEIKKAVIPAEPILDEEESATDVKATGVIEGTLSYPSQFVPEDMKVCAENIGTGEKICTDEHIKNARFTTGIGYSLTVPVGTYYVSATTNLWPAYTAFYNEFVVCGLQAGCPSHENVAVEVKEDEIVTDVSPIDWYDI